MFRNYLPRVATFLTSIYISFGPLCVHVVRVDLPCCEKFCEEEWNNGVEVVDLVTFEHVLLDCEEGGMVLEMNFWHSVGELR